MSAAGSLTSANTSAGSSRRGDFVLTAEDFRAIASVLHDEAGIALPASKATLVHARLVKRLRTLGLSTFREYCEVLQDVAGDERQQLVMALTTNVTSFFREKHHFDYMTAKLLPPLLAAARRGGRVRIWSAGCSNGAEPYSIGMTILAMMPEASSLDVRVLATDIDQKMVSTARQGDYRDPEFAAVSPALRRWFRNSDSDQSWQAGPELQSLISFREHNLNGSWPMKGPFDIIFCRNVAIYFNAETQSRIWHRFATLLQPQGHLMIGHSERISGPADAMLRHEGQTIYRREHGGRS